MTDIPAHEAVLCVECIKVAYRQAAEGPVIGLRIQLDDTTTEAGRAVALAPLNQRFAVYFVPLKDAE
jgi:hypothetical protein